MRGRIFGNPVEEGAYMKPLHVHEPPNFFSG